MAKCLVLGGNGFIGSHLVDSLQTAGHEVRVFDRFKDDNYLFTSNKSTEIYSRDFLNRSDIAESLVGIEYVFHFISTTTPATAENDPLIDVNTNVSMSIILFQECVKAKVKKVIFASTGGAIYGELSTANKETDMTLPISPYAIGKLTIENYLRYFRVKHGLDSIVMRISNPYGERQAFNRKQGVIPIFLENLYNNKPLVIFGDGTMERDYIYVKDVADAIVRTFNKKTKFNTYNIGSGLDTSVNELVDIVQKVTHKNAKIVTLPTPTTYIHKVVLDTSRFTNEFGAANHTTLENGIKKTYKYIEDNIHKY